MTALTTIDTRPRPPARCSSSAVRERPVRGRKRAEAEQDRIEAREVVGLAVADEVGDRQRE